MEDLLSEAVLAYKNKEYPSIRACAYAFSVPKSSLIARLSGRTSRIISHADSQILSIFEEETLIKTIFRASKNGVPITLTFARELAEEIRRSRYALSTTPTSYPPLGIKWLERFRKRHPSITSVFSRSIEASRIEAFSYAIVNAFFDALSDLFIENGYPPDAIFNVDETGFALGTTQSSKVLVGKEGTRRFKKIPGRQEWITAIECISASGTPLPPLVIFKAKDTNSGWIPAETPLEWSFSTSNSGWTSNAHGYKWLTAVFDPQTRRTDGKRRLLITDGHDSHLTAKFISYCIDKEIDLVVLPPHTSHQLQPLDVSIFSPLKRALSNEVEKLFRLTTRRIPRVEWMSAYIKARDRVFTSPNILSGFRGSGIYPLSPITILSMIPPPEEPRPSTPPPIDRPEDLDLSLLASSPPEGTEVRRANALVASIVRDSKITSPAKRYLERTGSALERVVSENALLRKENKELRELAQKRKERKTGKRVMVKGKFVFNTQEILDIVRTAEAEAVAKATKKGSRKRKRSPEKEEEEEEDSEDELLGL